MRAEIKTKNSVFGVSVTFGSAEPKRRENNFFIAVFKILHGKVAVCGDFYVPLNPNSF